MQGADIYSFTTLAHAQTLIELSAKIKRAVVIGGGLIAALGLALLFARRPATLG